MNKRVPTVDQAVEEIRAAFRDVRLGEGIGLFQAQAIDAYMSEFEQRAERERDEKENWERIPAHDLEHCHSSPCFLDAEGMRFLLPAFMVAELRGETASPTPIYYSLTNLKDDKFAGYLRSKLTLLSPAQRAAVRSFLELVREHPDNQFDRELIDAAYNDYWQGDRPSSDNVD